MIFHCYVSLPEGKSWGVFLWKGEFLRPRILDTWQGQSTENGGASQSRCGPGGRQLLIRWFGLLANWWYLQVILCRFHITHDIALHEVWFLCLSVWQSTPTITYLFTYLPTYPLIWLLYVFVHLSDFSIYLEAYGCFQNRGTPKSSILIGFPL